MTTTAIAIDFKDTCSCPVPWHTLKGSNRLRWSDSCQHYIYNPVGISNEELVSLILVREGIQPVELFRRQDGKVITRRCRAAKMSDFTPLIKALSPAAGLAVVILLWLGNNALSTPPATISQPSAESTGANVRSSTPRKDADRLRLLSQDVRSASADVVASEAVHHGDVQQANSYAMEIEAQEMSNQVAQQWGNYDASQLARSLNAPEVATGSAAMSPLVGSGP